MATKTWGYFPDKPKKPKMDKSTKDEISASALDFINNTLKPKYIKDTPT